MIFIIASTYDHARKWAQAQQLAEAEWFASLEISDLYGKENFHVIVLESASDLPPSMFEKIFNLAQLRGRINR